MAWVVFLRGVNVGGHRTFRPTQLADQLTHLDAVNIGAAGTFVIRKRIGVAALRAELAERLPFATEIIICRGSDIVALPSHEAFAAHPPRPGEVRFVSVLARSCRSSPALPMTFPARGRWLLTLLARDRRFVFGVYRRHLQVIRHFTAIDRLFDVPITTRNWNTITAVARVLSPPERRKV
jgi:uncharacterized protein (DUF1697 family)